MVELAPEIGPDFTAHIDPALAEREILAEIGAVLCDHAFEQGEPVVAEGRGVDGMIALIAELRIVRAHALQRLTADDQETGTSISDLDETAILDDGFGIVNFEHIF